MQRYALVFEYDGSLYHGWQKQPQRISIQEVVESAIGRVADHPVQTYCAGRTDAGVHASAQVVHFDSPAPRTPQQWFKGINTYLPPSIRLQKICLVTDDFHARYSAVSRRYIYLIDQAPVNSAFIAKYMYWYPWVLDWQSMHKAAGAFIGEHDFSAFRSSECQSVSPMRRIMAIDVYATQKKIIIDITGNAFLHHMVRLMVGHLIQIGRHRATPEWLASVLKSKQPQHQISMAPACGLHLVDVGYREEFGLGTILKKPTYI